MYTSYSTLQRKQLTKQVYTDTQSTYLLVYAPGRHQALEHALENQLHRKFRLVTELAPALTDSVEGVLLVSEDLECTSTALTYFAGALRTGADLVVCDAAFGFDGSTALYLSTQHIPCSRCAMVSRKLLDRIRAAARGRDSVTELLRLATAMAENCRRIPESLLHFRRELCADDVFSASGKRALILSHELTMTGAPIVLVSAVPVLRSMGFEVVVLGPADDGSLPLFLDAGAAVVTRSDCVMSSSLWGLATSADFVLANTVVEAAAVSTLNGSFVPVLWWLHDAFAGYPFIAHRIPKTLDSNVHVCAVGSHATAAMHSVRPDFNIEQLIYGLPDYAQESFPVYDISYAGGRPLFVTVGSFEPRKGQDIFCNAIRLLKPEVRQKAAFLFVGKAADKSLKSAVDALVPGHRVLPQAAGTPGDQVPDGSVHLCGVRLPRRPHAHLCHRGPDLRQALHRVGAHRHCRADHRGRGRLCVPGRRPRPAGKGAGTCHPAPRSAGRHEGRLPENVREILLQRSLCCHPDAAGERADHLSVRCFCAA